MKAFVLIKVEPGKVKSVVQEVSSMKHVKEVYCITGPDDIIAFLDAEDAKEISEVILADLHSIEGISATDTRLVVELS